MGSATAPASDMATECDAQTFANVAWAFTTLLIAPGSVTYAVCSEDLLALHSFDAQELANTAWAFARLMAIEKPLSEGIAAITVTCLSDLVSQNLTNTA